MVFSGPERGVAAGASCGEVAERLIALGALAAGGPRLFRAGPEGSNPSLSAKSRSSREYQEDRTFSERGRVAPIHSAAEKGASRTQAFSVRGSRKLSVREQKVGSSQLLVYAPMSN